MYYLKYYDYLVANVDVDNKVIEILKPDLFFDGYKKLIMFGDDFDAWVRKRIRPLSQKGFNDFVSNLNLDINSATLEIDILLATKAVNIKDKLWLASNIEDSYIDCSPWYSILNGTAFEISKEDAPIKLTPTKHSSFNLDGACKKGLFRLNNKLVIVKERLQDNSCDNIMEEIVYHICEKLDYPCSPAGVLSETESYSEIDEKVELEHAADIVQRNTSSFEEMYLALKRKGFLESTLLSVLKMGIVDCLTRQLDRNLTNFGFYKVNDIYHMYRLYDNGLSLFAVSSYRSELDAELGNGETIQSKIDFITAELVNYNLSSLFKDELTEPYLNSILSPFKVDIEKHGKVTISEIIDWVLRMQEHIKNLLAKRGICMYESDTLSKGLTVEELKIYESIPKSLLSYWNTNPKDAVVRYLDLVNHIN